MADLLTSVRTTLCEIANDSNIFQKLQVGKNFASEIVSIILKGLHLSENSEIERQVVNPISCGDCICRTHNLFGIKFYVQMSCRCGKRFDKKEHTTIIHKLDAGSPQTTKIKSFAELPVLLDEQLFCKGTCHRLAYARLHYRPPPSPTSLRAPRVCSPLAAALAPHSQRGRKHVVLPQSAARCPCGRPTWLRLRPPGVQVLVVVDLHLRRSVASASALTLVDLQSSPEQRAEHSKRQASAEQGALRERLSASA